MFVCKAVADARRLFTTVFDKIRHVKCVVEIRLLQQDCTGTHVVLF